MEVSRQIDRRACFRATLDLRPTTPHRHIPEPHRRNTEQQEDDDIPTSLRSGPIVQGFSTLEPKKSTTAKREMQTQRRTFLTVAGWIGRKKTDGDS